jgi:ubiquinol-cytochrome c reductase cytochrome b/c1 subunit
MAASNEKFDNKCVQWINDRLPIFSMMQNEYGKFPTPRNFNWLWNFGAIAMTMLGIMILTGIFLAMNYTPHSTLAFESVERMTRDVNYGWLLRYVHMNGASFFFIAVYIHIFRGLYYGSYKKPRELVWIFGVAIFLLMMATAFMGYALPWSQMSGWGVTVITSLFSAIPLAGDGLVTWLWGGFAVDNPTLNRFYALHFLLPFVICAVVFVHVWALHVTGSNNPTGVEPKSEKDTVAFNPYYTAKDSVGLVVFLIFFFGVVFFAPLLLSEVDHFRQFDPMQTPAHIVPEWYFLPFYAILRSFTIDIAIPFTGIVILSAKLQGVIAMFGSIILLFFLPWLDTSPVKSARYRPIYKWCMLALVVSMGMLTYAGAKPPEGLPVWIGRLGTLYYFAHFLVLLPYLGRRERTLPLPASISDDVAASGKKKALVAALLALTLLFAAPAQAGGEEHSHDGAALTRQAWPHHGPFGTYDRAALQRGFQVYKEVCAACHSLKFVAYRNLEALGYTPEQVKSVAAEYTVTDGPGDDGEMFERPARPSDRFKAPFKNDKAARAANNGALPPDLSLIVKARKGGEDYIYSLLTGYAEAPEGVTLMPGLSYNKAFPGHQIAMAQPLSAGQVAYGDGTENTLEQEARDVAQFLAWASEPHMEARKQMGIKVILFLLVFAGILWRAKKKVWSAK